ncbi:MAG: hypothetical protein SWH61_12990 [Thermodesulfobacteriota bacterium]|nr:hypothetical protein [Thermodesulfobacteriota bacterium]
MRAIGPLYNVPDRRTRAIETHKAAANTMARQQPGRTTHTEPPGKTAGGAIMNTMGGAMAGASAAEALGGIELASSAAGTAAAGAEATTALSALGGAPFVIGGMAALGLGAYLFS